MSTDTNVQHTIFKQGSRTYFYASRFFPDKERRDIEILYAFVRIIDDCVDQPVPDIKLFKKYKKLYHIAIKGKPIKQPVIQDFVDLMKRVQIEPEWVEAFWRSMHMDLDGRLYQTLDEVVEYVYGSAEVIGLMLARLLRLPPKAYRYAGLLGRAMQYANFIRDIDEDLTLGRCYFPTQVLGSYSISRVLPDTDFSKLVRGEIRRYRRWQKQAEQGYKYLPWRYRIPIKTAADMYLWTTDQIYKNPQIVWQQKVKPSRSRIITTGLVNAVTQGISLK